MLQQLAISETFHRFFFDIVSRLTDWWRESFPLYPFEFFAVDFQQRNFNFDTRFRGKHTFYGKLDACNCSNAVNNMSCIFIFLLNSGNKYAIHYNTPIFCRFYPFGAEYFTAPKRQE